MAKLIIGIDVGLDGAIAMECDGAVSVIDMPTVLDPDRTTKSKKRLLLEREFAAIIEERVGRDIVSLSAVKVIVEKQQYFPGPQAMASSKKMDQFGFIRGVLTALGVPFECVHPKTWQKALGKPQAAQAKEWSVQRAKRLYPEIAFGNKAQAEGRADALNLLDYGRLR